MPYVSQEQLAAARAVDLLTYLQRHEPEELVHISGGTYATRTHDSLKISNGKWCWWSRGIGGTNALDYLVMVRGLSLPNAVEQITGTAGYAPQPNPQPTKPKPTVQFILPPRHAYNRRVFSYLRSRGIDPEIINHCIKHGQLYEVRNNPNRKYITVKPPGAKRAIRLDSLGEGYTEADILHRLAEQRRSQDGFSPPIIAPPGKRCRLKGKWSTTRKKKITGFFALYLRYVYLLRGAKRKNYPKRLPFSVKQEVTRLERYSTSKRTVSAQRTYPNLSDADVSLIPKTVEENGRTLTLADVNWQEAATDPTDGYDLPIRYTAVASYTGTATSKYATGYTVTADYKGDVTRVSCDTVVYTAVFSAMGNNAEEPTEQSDFNGLWFLILAGMLVLGGCGYAGYKGFKHYRNKKRGYE